MATTSLGSQASPVAVRSAPAPEGFFLRQGTGQRFCVLHDCAAPARATAVFVHGFAEEMNKSRRMVSLQARALAASGCAVLLIDLRGCGDSSDLLSDVQWADWIADVHLAADWLTRRHPNALCWLWGLRAGCLIATAAAAQRQQACALLLWQPLASGKTLVQQFMRLKTAVHIGDPVAAKAATAKVHTDIAAGNTVEIAGYPIPASLLNSLQVAVLVPPRPSVVVRCLEVSPRTDAELLPVTAKEMAAWAGSGVDVRAQVVQGAAFWQTTEIETAPALITATLSTLGLIAPAANGAPAHE